MFKWIAIAGFIVVIAAGLFTCGLSSLDRDSIKNNVKGEFNKSVLVLDEKYFGPIIVKKADDGLKKVKTASRIYYSPDVSQNGTAYTLNGYYLSGAKRSQP